VIQCLLASAVTSLGSPDRLIWLCGRSRRLTSEFNDWNAAGGFPPRFDSRRPGGVVRRTARHDCRVRVQPDVLGKYL